MKTHSPWSLVALGAPLFLFFAGTGASAETSSETALAAQPAPSRVPAAGLVGHYRFEQNMSDGSGLANHGKSYAGFTYSDDTMEGLAAGEFDGNGSRVVIPSSDSLSITGDLTLAAWVNVRSISFASTPNILAKSFNNGYRLRLNPNGTLRLLLGNGTPNPAHFSSTRAIHLTEWTHVAVVVSFGGERMTVRFYINGVADPVVRTAPLSGIEPGDGPLVLGARADKTSATESLLGRLDQVTIHNRALSDAEVLKLCEVKP